MRNSCVLSVYNLYKRYSQWTLIFASSSVDDLFTVSTTHMDGHRKYLMLLDAHHSAMGWNRRRLPNWGARDNDYLRIHYAAILERRPPLTSEGICFQHDDAALRFSRRVRDNHFLVTWDSRKSQAVCVVRSSDLNAVDSIYGATSKKEFVLQWYRIATT
jgi:hypothetical protein